MTHLKNITNIASTDSKIRQFKETLTKFRLKSEERLREKESRTLSVDKFERLRVASPLKQGQLEAEEEERVTQ